MPAFPVDIIAIALDDAESEEFDSNYDKAEYIKTVLNECGLSIVPDSEFVANEAGDKHDPTASGPERLWNAYRDAQIAEGIEYERWRAVWREAESINDDGASSSDGAPSSLIGNEIRSALVDLACVTHVNGDAEHYVRQAAASLRVAVRAADDAAASPVVGVSLPTRDEIESVTPEEWHADRLNVAMDEATTALGAEGMHRIVSARLGDDDVALRSRLGVTG